MNIFFEHQDDELEENPDSLYSRIVCETILEKWDVLDDLKKDRTYRLNFLSKQFNGGKNSGNHNPGQGRGVGKPNGGSSLKNYGKNDSKIRELRKSLAEKKDTVAWYRGETGTSFEMGEVERKTVKEEVEEAINMIQTYKEAIKSVPDATEKLKSAMETEEHRLDSLIKRINEDSDATITRDNVLEEIDNVVNKVEKDYNDAYKELYELRKNPYPTINISEQYQGIQPSGKNIASESERLKISRETIGDFDSGIASEWLQGETYEVKSDIRKEIEKSQKLRDAMLSQMYYESDSKVPYKEWLETPVTLKRQQNTDIPRDTDTFLSFSQAKEWNGENTNDTVFPADIITVKVRPKDTFGTIPVYEGEAYAEKEVLVPSEVFLKSLNLDVQSTKRQNRIQILSLKFNGGKNSGNHNPGQGRGVGKPGAGTSRLAKPKTLSVKDWTDYMNSDISQRQGNASIYDETAGNCVVVKSSKNAGVFEGMNPISKTATKKNIDSMTPEEKQAITNYTSEYNAGNSTEVNRYLRSGEGSETSKKAAELLTSALDKCKLGTNTVLFRGVEPSIFGAEAEKAIKKLNRAVKNHYTKNFDSSLNKLSSLEGTIIQDKGCMSTSTVFDRKYTERGVIMRIQASKNDKACDIYDLSRYGGNRDAFSKMFGYSYETAENEVLFAPNSKLKIIGTTVTSDGVVLDCKTV